MKIKEEKEKTIVKNKWMQNDILTDEDFYPPFDDRTIHTYMREIYNGEFFEYAEYIYDLYESEDYYEN